MKKNSFFSCLIILFFFISCEQEKQKNNTSKNCKTGINETVIIDCNYSFDEAIIGSKAPQNIINELTLFDVKYFSTDKKVHQGQILTNKFIAKDLKAIFDFIYKSHFPVKQVVPIVRFNWNDELSMEANNTYSFCYRDISFSKHAKGMAIDINPLFNPQRWKDSLSYKPVKPKGAVYNPEIPGTFTSSSPIVSELKKHGFRWGHYFSMKYDDHHFQR